MSERRSKTRDFTTYGSVKKGAQSADLREAILYAAWGIGQWAAYDRAKGLPPPEWATEICQEFFIGVAVSPRIIDDAAKGPKPSRKDLLLLVQIAELLSGSSQGDVADANSVRAALLKLLPVARLTQQELENKIRRLTDLYNRQMPKIHSGEHESNPATEYNAKLNSARRRYRNLGDEDA